MQMCWWQFAGLMKHTAYVAGRNSQAALPLPDLHVSPSGKVGKIFIAQRLTILFTAARSIVAGSCP